MERSRLLPVSTEEFTDLASGHPIPVEQAPVWDAYDGLAHGRRPWQRFALRHDGDVVALVSLAWHAGRGFRFLWAKQGPVWLTDPTPELERELRRLLVTGVRRVDPRVAFVRLHAWHPDDDLHPLLQGVTYDATVRLEIAGRSDADLMAAMKKRGRRDLRKGLREQPVDVTDETTAATTDFDPYYRVLRETAERDGFGIHPAGVYTDMLRALAPAHARVYAARHDGELQAWALLTLNDGEAKVYYAAGTAAGRAHEASMQLYWETIRRLRDEGVRTWDLMGIGSPSFPALESLTTMKTKFAEAPTAVAPAWDVPVWPMYYRGLVVALAAKRRAARAAAQAVAGLRRGVRGRQGDQ